MRSISIYILFILVFVGATSCKTYDVVDEHSELGLEREQVVEYAHALLGSSYKYAGKGPRQFDCSGLVGYVYQKSGIPVSGSSQHLSERDQSISLKNVTAGDLVFFKRKGRVFHVSIVVEVSKTELWVVHSTSSRGVIKEDVLASSYWRPLIFKAVSLRSYK